MRSTPILLFLLIASVGCGSEESNQEEVVYLDASAAIDAGHQAWAEGNYLAAAEAYQAARFLWVSDAPSSLDRDLVFRQCLALVGAGQDGEAIDQLIAYVESAPETLDADSLRNLVDACLQSGPTTSTSLAEIGVRVARDTLTPEQRARFDFNHVESALAALQSGDLTTLANLGYVDPEASSARPKPKPEPKVNEAAIRNEEDPGL